MSPFATPPRSTQETPPPTPTQTRQSTQETPTPTQTQDFARHTSFTPAGTSTPSSVQTNIPLLPTNAPILPVPTHHPRHDEYAKKPMWRQVLTGANEFMLGKEKASVYWYASLMSVLAALVVTGSSIFGWPPLPIWEYLRHVTG
ncbi:hypothetical protein N657DRAFT_614827 [Parathielavia appendiculata]|uniref:Uncharacterized protein n=1 Tax=Parathielavia appendiculata TaxID=2587402 RepID=A0AAN6U756_9PEZI|nr:hypothetical protein N657DRAFT_614827 [Parathielavia appendiculata]